MKRRNLPGILVCLVVFSLVGWAFARIIWVPLYGYQKTAEYVAQQDEPVLRAEIERRDARGTRSWTVADPRALEKLHAGLVRADYAPASLPATQETYRIRLRRADSRLDEYEVVLDEQGSSRDLIYVVGRKDGPAITGSAFRIPQLRSALEQILRDRPPSSP